MCYSGFDVSPLYNGNDVSFSYAGILPSGLNFSWSTGRIYGASQGCLVDTVYATITATNSKGSTSTVVSMTFLHPPYNLYYNLDTYWRQVGDYFDETPHCAGTVDYYTISSGTLPSGLNFNSNNGRIYGYCSASATRTLTIRAYNDVGYDYTTITINVRDYPESFSYSNPTRTVEKGVFLSMTPSVDCNGCSFSIHSGSLPTGLSLSSSNGVVSGTPTQYVVNREARIRAENNDGYLDAVLKFTVLTRPSGFSYSSSNHVLTTNSNLSLTPTVTGDSLSFSVSSGSLPSGLSLSSSTGAISGTVNSPTPLRTVRIKAQNGIASVTTDLTFHVLTPPSDFSYSPSQIVRITDTAVSLTPLITGSELQFSLSSGSLPEGLSLSSTTGTLSGIVITSTEWITLTVKAENILSSVETEVTFKFATPPSNFTYPNSELVLATNTMFSVTPTISGDPCTFSIFNNTLPEGLAIQSQTGIISGKPLRTTELSEYEIIAKNDGGEQVFTLYIEVLEAPNHFSYPKSTYRIVKGEPFSVTPKSKGDELLFTISEGLLPLGLSFNNITGEISGIPTEDEATTTLLIEAENRLGVAETELTIKVRLTAGLSAGWIVFIIVVILLVIAAVVLFVFRKKSNRRVLKKQSPKKVEMEKKKSEKESSVKINMEEVKKEPVTEEKKEPVTEEKKEPVTEEKKEPVTEEKKEPVTEEKKEPVTEEKEKTEEVSEPAIDKEGTIEAAVDTTEHVPVEETK